MLLQVLGLSQISMLCSNLEKELGLHEKELGTLSYEKELSTLRASVSRQAFDSDNDQI